MTTRDNTGGNAFPDEFHDGMTLLDHFAGQALVRLVLSWAPERCAEKCYDYAEAMVAEKKKREGGK